MCKDELKYIIVGDPDPTPDLPGRGRGHPDDFRCGFEWVDKVSQTLTLLWLCTREPGHPGQHLAGTGESVAAVHPERTVTRHVMIFGRAALDRR